jgi:lipoyl(octanoyl) transferase
MAVDHALMARARLTGDRVFRVYSWKSPTLSLGRHQAAKDRFDEGKARALGVSLVRRPTGGRALLHHREVTYSVTAALSRDESVRDWYQWINTILLAGLRAIGVSAQTAAATRAILPASASCFAQPDEGEITVEGRKLVGSALLRQDGALLQHGSILLDDDQPLLNSLLPDGELRPVPAGTLRQALGVAPTFDRVADGLVNALASSGDVAVEPLEPDAWFNAECQSAERIYGSPEWTFRN